MSTLEIGGTPRVFHGSLHPYLVLRGFGGTLAGLIGVKIKELLFLAAPLALLHGTRVFRGIPVGITALGFGCSPVENH